MRIFVLAYWISVVPIDSIFVRLHLLSQQNVIFCYQCINILVPNHFHKERTCWDLHQLHFFQICCFSFKKSPRLCLLSHSEKKKIVIHYCFFLVFAIKFDRDVHILLIKISIKSDKHQLLPNVAKCYKMLQNVIKMRKICFYLKW